MLLWVILAFLTAAALLAIIYPLGRGRAASAALASGTSVYRDQLRALEADIDRGLLDESEAEAARIEISRRLLETADAEKAKSGAHSAATRRTGPAVALCAFVVAVALGGYLATGSPNLPGQPAAQRAVPQLEQQQFSALVAKVEEHLIRNPRDGRGWDIIAPAYLRLREFSKAANAYRHAIDLVGPSAARYGGYGEALAMNAAGVITEEARRAFSKARELDPKLVRPRFFLGIAHEQDGDWDEAAKAWRDLLASTPAQAAYREIVERKLAEAEARAGGEAGGPSLDDVKRAQSLSEEQRQAMIEQMVAGLAARLEKNGNDIEGWLRLIRSYAVLGRTAEARAAAGKARVAFQSDGAARTRIDTLVRELGMNE